MANLVACPKCSAQLSLPADGPPDAQVQCPLCDEAFPLSAAKRTRVAEAVLVTLPTTTPEPKQKPEPASTELFGTIELPSRAAPLKPVAPPEPVAEVAQDDGPQSPADEQPIPSTLSDWLKKEPTGAQPLSDPHQTVEVAATEPKPTANESPDAMQPSLESLLSSFRRVTPSKSTSQSPRSGFGESAEPAGEVSPQSEPTTDASSDDSYATTTFSSIGTVSDFAPVAAADPAGEPETRDKAPTRASEPLSKDFQFDMGPQAASIDPTETYEPTGPAVSTLKRRSSRRSVHLQTLGVLLGGGVGIALGYLGLLWFKGPEGDVLGASRFLPSAFLPGSFASAPLDVSPDGDSQEPAVAPRDTNPSGGAPIATIQDDSVEPASFDDLTANPTTGGNSVTSNDIPDEPSPLGLIDPARGGGPSTPRVLDAPGPYSLAQLKQTLVGAEEARRLLSQQSLAANPEAAKDLGGAYAKLCQVALVLSFVEEPANDRDMTSLEAKELYHRLFQYGHARDDARDMATRWLGWNDRAHGGVFFAGKLVSGEQLGDLYQYKVQLAGGEPVVVLSDTPLRPERFLRAESIGVVGTIVESPRQRIRGYTGDVERAVWACHSISLGEPQFD